MAVRMNVSPAEAAQMLAAGGATLVDVREDWERDIVSIPGALAIPLATLPQRRDELPKDQPILCLCHHGMRSMNAANWMRSQGFAQAQNVDGGVDAWARLVDPRLARY